MNTVINSLFAGSTENSHMKLSIRSRTNIQISIITMILLTVMNLLGTVKILVMIKFIYGIKNTPYHPPKFLVFVVCRVTSKFLGIVSAESSWGGVKTIK